MSPSSQLWTNLRRRMPFLVSALALPVCSFVIHPTLAMGTNDDWSYTRSALLFAQTGHFLYVGWSSAMLGWQVVLAAFFIKLFGFSFDVVRYAGLLIATATAVIFQRTCVRCGIREQNAALATLALIFSPLFLPLAFSFMTDVPGVFCIVLCLYLCIRALQSSTSNQARTWLIVAALTNVVDGTCRQSSWLGVLVMVPCALWLLRRRGRSLVLPVMLVYEVSAGCVFYLLKWFERQPHSITEPILPGAIHSAEIQNLCSNLLNSSVEISVLLLPVLFFYFPVLWARHPRWVVLIVLLALGAGLFCLPAIQNGTPIAWLAPTMQNYVTVHGVDDGTPILGQRPVVLSEGLRLAVTITSAAAVLAFLIFFFFDRQRSTSQGATQSTLSANSLSTYEIAILLFPFTAAYIGAVLSRVAFHLMWDRYLLPFLMVAILLLVRYADRHLKPQLSWAFLVPIAIYAEFSIAATHDAFAMYRAELAAVQEMRSAGVPNTAIDGGFEYNGWTQVEISGYLSNPLDYRPLPPCLPLNGYLFPAVVPRYILSYDPNSCGGPAPFAPITYREWLGPPAVTISIVRTGMY